MEFDKRGDSQFISKHVIYLILIFALVIIIYFIVKGIINKLITLY